MAETFPHAQAEVTSTVRVDPELQSRYQNRDLAAGGTSYPVATHDELRVMRNELVFGWRRPVQTQAAHRPGRASEAGFTSFNGIPIMGFTMKEDLADALYLIGASNTNHNPFDPLQVQNDLAVTRFGIARVEYDMVQKPCYPGDTMVWQIPDFPDAAAGVQPHAGLTNERPRNKLLGFLEPFDPSMVTDHFNLIFATMMSNTDGVYGMSLDRLDPRRARGLGAREQAALALKQFTLFTGLQTVAALAARGLVRIVTPSAAERERAVAALVRAVAPAVAPGAAAPAVDAEAAVAAYRAALAAVEETDPDKRVNMTYMSETVDNMRAELPHLVGDHAYFRYGLDRTALAPDERSREELRDQRAQLYLAMVLGAVGGEGDTRLMVQEDVLYSVFSQFAHIGLGTSEYVPNMQTLKRHTGTPLAREYVARATAAPTQFAEAMQNAIHGLSRRIAGTALQFSEGRRENDRVDVFLGGGVGLHQ